MQRTKTVKRGGNGIEFQRSLPNAAAFMEYGIWEPRRMYDAYQMHDTMEGNDGYH